MLSFKIYFMMMLVNFCKFETYLQNKCICFENQNLTSLPFPPFPPDDPKCENDFRMQALLVNKQE